MTPKEFKAWFEGFTEAMDGQPTPAQWAKIKERVCQIDGSPVSYPVYVDRYWPRVREYWAAADARWGNVMSDHSTAVAKICSSSDGMHLLGKADWSEMKAS